MEYGIGFAIPNCLGLVSINQQSLFGLIRYSDNRDRVLTEAEVAELKSTHNLFENPYIALKSSNP